MKRSNQALTNVDPNTALDNIVLPESSTVMNLIEIQLELEESMTARGAERYLKKYHESIKHGTEQREGYAQVIVSHKLAVLREAIDNWKETVASGGAGTRNSTSYQKIKDIDSTLMSFVTLQTIMAKLSRESTLQAVAVGIGRALEDELKFKDIREKEKQFHDKLKDSLGRIRTDYGKRVYVAKMSERKNIHWVDWTRPEFLHVGTKLLEICIDCLGLVEVITTDIRKNHTVKFVRATAETMDWIEKRVSATAFLRPLLEPMVTPPRDWTTPYDGGYLTLNTKALTLVKSYNKAYLEELSNTEMPNVYKAVNALQQTAWQINSQVLAVAETLWKNESTLGGLPPRNGLEIPPKPWDIDTNLEARKQWCIEACKAHQDERRISGHRIRFSILLGTAKRYERFKKIYMPYQLDFRGRIYAVPNLNPQGDDISKAMLRFADGKPLGSQGWRWLAIHGANCAGVDKVSFEDRIQWVLNNTEEICAIAGDPYTFTGWCKSVGDAEIDKPWQFLAFCHEWAGYQKHGETFVSKLPIALDGSCSGIQHFSAMLRDTTGGNAVNLTPSDKPQDVYGLVAKECIRRAEEDAKNGTDDVLGHSDVTGTAFVVQGTKSFAKQWLEFGITRKVTKRPVMTLAYGSKEYGFKEQLMEDILIPARRLCGEDRKGFPFHMDGYPAAQYMARLIWESVRVVLSKAGEAMEWLQQIAKIAAKDGLPVRWTTPAGLPVMQAYQDVEHRRLKTVMHGTLVYLTLNKEKDSLDRRKQSAGIAPNFVHSCDASHLMMTVVKSYDQGIRSFGMIHDSFATTAHDTDILFKTVREAFVEMYEGTNILEEFKKEVTQDLKPKALAEIPDVPLQDDLDLKLVLESKYCFA